MEKNLRRLIHKNRSNFLEQQIMSKDNLEIQNLIGTLDEVAVRYEAKWGADRLHKLVGAEMQEKWFRQYDKLCDAINDNNILAIRDLVPGTIRAYAAMEAKALELGAAPNKPEVWDIAMLSSDRVLRVCKCLADASQVSQEGHDVWALEEIANFISANGRLVSKVKEVFPGAVIEKPPFDFKKGDELPEF